MAVTLCVSRDALRPRLGEAPQPVHYEARRDEVILDGSIPLPPPTPRNNESTNKSVTGAVLRSDDSSNGSSINTNARIGPYHRSRRRGESQVGRPLSSPDSRLALAFKNSYEQSEHHDRWLTLIPSRLGYDRTADFSVKVFLASADFCHDPTPTARKVHQQAYARALQSLRTSLITEAKAKSSEDTLLAIAILISTEFMVYGADLFTHLKGAGALLAAQPDDGTQASELARAIMMFNWVATFAVPLGQGTSSPYDTNPRWLDMDPPECHATTAEAMRLRKISHKLFIRLPRLIAAVRTLRTSDNVARSTFVATADLAKELLKLEDKAAESEVLHTLSVRKTPHPDGLVVPYRFHFPDYHLYEALVYYYQTRILLIKLCLKLADLRPPSHPVCDPRVIAALKDQNTASAINILMSLPHATHLGRYGRHTMFIGAVALWSVTINRERLRNTPVSLVKPYILRSYGELFGHDAPASEKDMNEASDMLMGGPIGGLLVDTRHVQEKEAEASGK